MEHGTHLTLSSQGRAIGPFQLVRKPQQGRVSLRSLQPSPDDGCLRTLGSGRVDNDGGGGIWAQYVLDETLAAGVTLLSFGFLEQTNTNRYLRVAEKAGQLYVGVTEGEPHLWTVDILEKIESSHERPAIVAGAPA